MNSGHNAVFQNKNGFYIFSFLKNWITTSFPGPFPWLAGGTGKGPFPPRPQAREKALGTRLIGSIKTPKFSRNFFTEEGFLISVNPEAGFITKMKQRIIALFVMIFSSKVFKYNFCFIELWVSRNGNSLPSFMSRCVQYLDNKSYFAILRIRCCLILIFFPELTHPY